MMKEIKVKSEKDDLKMKNQMRFEDKNKTNLPACKYYFVSDWILISAERIVISFSPQKRILNELHSGHLVISKMKSLMKSYVF